MKNMPTGRRPFSNLVPRLVLGLYEYGQTMALALYGVALSTGMASARPWYSDPDGDGLDIARAKLEGIIGAAAA